jgi:hypothetical protein
MLDLTPKRGYFAKSFIAQGKKIQVNLREP